MKKRIRVLLNWDTTRPDLFQPFISLKDEIEFVVIWKGDNDHSVLKHPFKEIFFNDYKSPYEILNDLQPEKVIFFGVHSYPQIALNLAARNQGIPTFTLHHGIYASNSIEINKQKQTLGTEKKGKLLNNLSSLLFYIAALRLKNIDQIFKYLYYPWVRRKYNVVLAQAKCQFEGKLPTKFIQLSPHNAIATKEIYNVFDNERFIYIGHPFFDNILSRFKELEQENDKKDEKYFLLIDFPNIDSNIAFKLMGVSEKHLFYKKLSLFAKALGYRLKIKLHPMGYSSLYNYSDDNIDLVYEDEIASLIYHADSCFSFYSSLLIPIIYLKRHCFIFDIGSKINVQDELVELGVATKLDPKNFSIEQITKPVGDEFDKYFKVFVERYLYMTDGKATIRLGSILLN